jgi:adenosine deaminase
VSLTSTPTDEQIKRVPKALLHDHLDGGLRPQTIIELSQKIGYKQLKTQKNWQFGLRKLATRIHLFVILKLLRTQLRSCKQRKQ